MSVSVQHSVSTFIMQKTLQLFYLLLLSLKIYSSQQCPHLEFLNFNTDTLSVPESSLVNLTFWLNDSGCEKSDLVYRGEVQTKLNVGIWEYDGRIIQTNNCTEITSTSVGCLSAAGPARLYKALNRSHEEIEWTWNWKDSGDIKTLKKGLKLYVLYPPSVQSLTVDGNDVNGTYLINEGQRVNISCSFEKGCPPANFSLLEKNRVTRILSDIEGPLNHSLTIRCDDEWPNISCEGNGSSRNQSVSFRVRCPPRFVNKSAKIFNSSVPGNVTLHVRAYTVNVSRCVLTSLSSYNNTQRDVNCSLSGDPPDLVLIFQLDNKDISITKWILTLYNEKGSANVTLSLSQDLKEATTQKDETITDNGQSFLLIFSVLPIVIVIALAISVIVIMRSRKQNNDKRTRSEEARRASRENMRENYPGVAYSAAGVSDVAACAGKMASESTSDGRNADGLIYGDLDFSNTRTTHEVITDVPETEYAAINFTAVVPPSRAYRQKADSIYKNTC